MAFGLFSKSLINSTRLASLIVTFDDGNDEDDPMTGRGDVMVDEDDVVFSWLCSDSDILPNEGSTLFPLLTKL